MKSVITVIGVDAMGIIAKVSAFLADNNINIVDIVQTTEEKQFLMVMIVDLNNALISFSEISEKLKALGDEMSLRIQVRHKKVFDSMHRI